MSNDLEKKKMLGYMDLKLGFGVCYLITFQILGSLKIVVQFEYIIKINTVYRTVHTLTTSKHIYNEAGLSR